MGMFVEISIRAFILYGEHWRYGTAMWTLCIHDFSGNSHLIKSKRRKHRAKLYIQVYTPFILVKAPARVHYRI